MRESNLELLRILSMLMILSLHYWGFGIDICELKEFTFPYFFGNFIRGVSYISVNLFVLISGYFLCKTDFKISRIKKTYYVVFYYSTTIYIISLVSGASTFSFFELFKAFTPIISNEYWFMSCYIGLLFFSPFINILINNLCKNDYIKLLSLVYIFFSVIPIIFFYSKWQYFGSGGGLVWFVVLYLSGAFIRIYEKDINTYIYKKDLNIRTHAIIGWLLPFVSAMVIAVISKLITGSVIGSHALWGNNSPIILYSSITTFLYFKKIKIKNETLIKCVNFISPSILSVYLITEHKSIRGYIWTYVSENTPLTLHIVFDFTFTIILLFSLSIGIDMVRRALVIGINKLVNK